MSIAEQIERLLNSPADQVRQEALPVVKEFRDGLSRGQFRAAEKIDGVWRTNVWVKRGLLLAFRVGVMEERSVGSEFAFFDKDTLPHKPLDLSSGVRVASMMRCASCWSLLKDFTSLAVSLTFSGSLVS